MNHFASVTITDSVMKIDKVVPADTLYRDSAIYNVAWNGSDQLTAVLSKGNWSLLSIDCDAGAWLIK